MSDARKQLTFEKWDDIAKERDSDKLFTAIQESFQCSLDLAREEFEKANQDCSSTEYIDDQETRIKKIKQALDFCYEECSDQSFLDQLTQTFQEPDKIDEDKKNGLVNQLMPYLDKHALTHNLTTEDMLINHAEIMNEVHDEAKEQLEKLISAPIAEYNKNAVNNFCNSVTEKFKSMIIAKKIETLIGDLKDFDQKKITEKSELQKVKDEYNQKVKAILVYGNKTGFYSEKNRPDFFNSIASAKEDHAQPADGVHHVLLKK